jgi:hypothetical protein
MNPDKMLQKLIRQKNITEAQSLQYYEKEESSAKTVNSPSTLNS